MRTHERIRLARVIAGITLAELAERSSIKWFRLLTVVYGRCLPTAAEAESLARVLHRTAGELFPEVKK
ncbi:MAG: helix-turn-helix transcriptional regulator [Kiritimatiellia bacterium]